MLSETEVARVVVEHLRADGWNVYQEVSMGYADAVHDIVATRPGIFWVIETKTTLNLEVIGQAERAWYATLRSVAVPKAKKRPYQRPPFAHLVCERFGIGVLRVGHEKHERDVLQAVPPRYNRIGAAGQHQWEGRLCDDRAEFCTAGSAGGGYWTPWKETMDHVRRHVADNPGCTVKEIVEQWGPMHYASTNGFANGIRFALKKSLLEGVRLDADKSPWRLYPVEEKTT